MFGRRDDGAEFIRRVYMCPLRWSQEKKRFVLRERLGQSNRKPLRVKGTGEPWGHIMS